MRTPGGPVTRDDVLPTSSEVRDKDRQGGFARLHNPLRELADLLGSQKSLEGLPYRDEAPAGNADSAATRTKLGLARAERPNGDRSQNWELAISAFEDASSVLTRERNHEGVLPNSSDVR